MDGLYEVRLVFTELTLLEGRLSVMKNGWIFITLLYGNSIHGKTHLVPD